MTQTARRSAWTAVGVLMFASLIAGREPLRMQATPSNSRAPAFVTVRVSLDAAADDRLLRIVAESDDYFRSSDVQIDGVSGPALSVFELRELPPGTYRITGTLVGVHGQRANAAATITVQPAF